MFDRLNTVVTWVRDPNNLTAVSTAVIAFFTFVLAAVGYAQARLIRKSIDLARAEFSATHRPKIVVHLVELKKFPDPSKPGGSQLDQLGITMLCFNKGRGAAKNVEVRGDFYAATQLPDPKIMRRLREPPIGSVASGIKIWFEANSERTILDIAGLKSQGIDAYFVGVIVYFDGTDRRRETGFCFRFNIQSMQWYSVGSAEHEYAY